MKRKPAVLLKAAGFFVFATACGTGTQATPFGASGSSTQTTENPAVMASCTAYCNHVYGTATGCSEELLSVQAAGCHGFCSTLAASVPDDCVEPVVNVHECIVDEAIPYSCSDESSSPAPLLNDCEALWDEADDCMSGG